MPTLFVQNTTVSEAEGAVDVRIRLDEPSAGTVTVAWASADGWADGSAPGRTGDFVHASGSLIFAPGETEKTVRITLLNGGAPQAPDAEQNEWFFVKLSNPVGATLGNDGSGRVDIVDNDTVVPAPLVYVSDVWVDEGAGEARFVVTLGRDRGTASSAPVSVDVDTQDGSATANGDYTSVHATLTFALGETAKTVVVPLIDDGITEEPEAFTLRLSNVQGGSIGRAEASASIAASDATVTVRPKIVVSSAVMSEGTPWIDIPVTLSAPSAQRITVRWQTVDDSATTYVAGRPGQVVAYPGLLSFEPGQTLQTIRIYADPSNLLVDGAYPEVERRLAVALTEPTNAVLDHEGVAWITFVSNDQFTDTPLLFVRDVVVDEAAGQAVFALTLGNVYGQATDHPVSVQVGTADGSAQAGSDYLPVSRTVTFLPGESVQTVAVPLLNDSVLERAETFHLTLSNPQGATVGTPAATATIGANDSPTVALPRVSAQSITVSEADRWADVVISLSAPSTSQVAVLTALRASTATSGDFGFAPGAVVFEPGETTRVLRVDISGTVASSDGVELWERLKLVLSSPVGATLGGGGESWIDIVDNDTRVDSPVVTARDVRVDETAGQAIFVITLGRAAGSSTHAPIELDYTTRDGSARAGQDYLPVQGKVVFLPGESAKTIAVPLLNDAIPEAVETFELVLAGTAVDGAPIETHAGAAIAPSDRAPKLLPALSALPAVVTEDDAYADVWVLLDAPSAQPVSVNWALTAGTADTRDYERGSGTLVFDPGVVSQTVRVLITPDATLEGSETLKVTLSRAQGATLGEAQATILIVDAAINGVPVQSLGMGNDRVQVSASTDIVIDTDFGGLDTVVSAVDFTLIPTVEALVLRAPAVSGTGSEDANFFIGHTGNNRFDGKDGIDTVVYASARAAYAIAGDSGNYIVSGADAGQDTLLSIERLRFSDQLIATDTTPGGRAFEVAALLNVGFNQVPSMSDVSRWTAEFDQLARDYGESADIAQRMLDYYVPGGIPDDALVAHLWQSVVGSPITPADLSTFAGQLTNGTYTQASLLVLAAEHALNVADLAGLVGVPWVLNPQDFDPIVG